METQNQGHGRFLLPVIEDAVQLWHFVQLSRKYSKTLIQNDNIYTKFVDRARLVQEKHMKLQREKDSLDEILDDLADMKAGHIKPTPKVPRVFQEERGKVREAMGKVDADLNQLQKKPHALMRSIHSILVEMDARLKRIENSISSNNH